MACGTNQLVTIPFFYFQWISGYSISERAGVALSEVGLLSEDGGEAEGQPGGIGKRGAGVARFADWGLTLISAYPIEAHG